MDWIGALIFLSILWIYVYIFARVIIPSLTDEKWDIGRNLTKPRIGDYLYAFFGLFRQTAAAIRILVAMLTIIFALTVVHFVSHAMANPPGDGSSPPLMDKYDAMLTRTTLPVYKELVFPLINISTNFVERAVIAPSNFIGGSVLIFNRAFYDILRTCEDANFRSATSDIGQFIGAFIGSILDFLINLVSGRLQNFDFQTPVLYIQSALGNGGGIFSCLCEIMRPFFDIVINSATSSHLAQFLDGIGNLFLPISFTVDFLNVVFESIRLVIRVFITSTPGDFIYSIKEAYFENLEREPHFYATANSTENVLLGGTEFIDDVLIATIKGFKPSLSSTYLPRVISPLGHVGAALTEALQMIAKGITHFFQFISGVYWGQLQHMMDSIDNHTATAGEMWRITSTFAQTSFGQNIICSWSGIFDGSTGFTISYIRAVIGLVRSGREDPLPYAVRYNRQNMTAYFDFLTSSKVRGPLQRSRAGFQEFGVCSYNLLAEVNQETADVWLELFHVFEGIIKPFAALIDNRPLFGSTGYLSGGYNISDYKVAVDEAFDEARYFARAFGNLFSQLMREPLAFTTYTKTRSLYSFGYDPITLINNATGSYLVSSTITDNVATLGTVSVTDDYSFGETRTFSTYSFSGGATGPTQTEFTKLVSTTYTREEILITTLTLTENYTESQLLSWLETRFEYLPVESSAIETFVFDESPCSSRTIPHAAYPHDTIYDPYADQEHIYGWCCIGRFIERLLLLWIEWMKIITDVSISLATRDGPSDTFVSSLAGLFCANGPGDLKKNFYPLVDVMIDDAVCVFFGMLSAFVDSYYPGSISLPMCYNGLGNVPFRVLHVVFEILGALIRIPLLAINFVMRLFAGIASQIGGFSGPGFCPLIGGPSVYYVPCDYLLVGVGGSININGICDLLKDYYEFTFGYAVDVFVAFVDIFRCGISGLSGNIVQAFGDYFGKNGVFIQDKVCQLVQMIARVFLFFKLLFEGNIYHKEDPSAFGFIICKLRQWIPFVDKLLNLADNVKCKFQAFLTLFKGRRLLDCIGTCVACPDRKIGKNLRQRLFRSIWDGSKVQLSGKLESPGTSVCTSIGNKWNTLTDQRVIDAGIVTEPAPCKVSIQLNDDQWFKDWTGQASPRTFPRCCVCTDIFGACDAQYPLSKALTNVSTLYNFTECDYLEEMITNETSPGTLFLLEERFRQCKTSAVLAKMANYALLAEDGEELITPDVFSNVPEFLLFSGKILATAFTSLREAFAYSTSFVDPYDLTQFNCSEMYPHSGDPLDNHVCVLVLEFTRALREWDAAGNYSLFGMFINAFGSMNYISDIYSTNYSAPKSLGYGSYWSQELLSLELRANFRKARNYIPPLGQSLERWKFVPWDTTWIKGEILQSFTGGGTFPEIPGLGVQPVYNKISQVYYNSMTQFGSVEKSLSTNFTLPPDLLCPTEVPIPSDILDLSCEARNPMWDALGNVIGPCLFSLHNFWEIPSCTTNYSATTGFCCPSCTPCASSPCTSLDCSASLQVYGNCTQCSPLLDPTFGACCFANTCFLTNTTNCPGTFAGVGVFCNDQRLPLECKACAQVSCRRCEIIPRVIEQVGQLAITIGDDLYQIFVNDGPEVNFTDSVLPNFTDVNTSDYKKTDTIGEFTTRFTTRIYNFIVRASNAIFSTSFKELDPETVEAQTYSILNSTKENSLSNWLEVFGPCDVTDHISCARGKRGVGIIKAAIFVTLLINIIFILIRRFIPFFSINFIAGYILLVIWSFLTIQFAFGISFRCFFKLRFPFFGPPSLFYIFPLFIPFTPLPVPPIMPICAPSQLRQEIFEPLLVDCLDRCTFSCPEGPECFPCAWLSNNVTAIPGVNCRANITDCCTVCKCPEARHNFVRKSPDCHAPPFNFRTSTREALYYIRTRFPRLFCMLKHASNFELSDAEDWNFSANDCNWNTIEEANEFRIHDKRWDHCYDSNRGLWSTWLLLALVGGSTLLGYLFYLSVFYSTLLMTFSYYVSALAGLLSEAVGLKNEEYRSVWRKFWQIRPGKLPTRKIK